MHYAQFDWFFIFLVHTRTEFNVEISQGHLSFALLGTGALTGYTDLHLGTNRAVSDRFKEMMPLIVNGAVMPGAYQQINLAGFALLIKKLKEISLPIHHAYLMRVGDLLGYFNTFAQPLNPGKGLFLFNWNARGRAGVGI